MRLETGFFDQDPVHLTPTQSGPLSGLTFAVKDLFDLAGSVTGLGNPTWRDTHGPALANAPCVDRLLQAGAELVGKTHTDELAYSLAGQNQHYGTPPNPAVPDGIPGGSSSGSASVVAAKLVDFALGTDTGGSVRVPASYCGIYGLRPTHGAVDTTGVAHLAKSFDTVGWFARSADVMLAVGRELLPDRPMPMLRQIRLLKEGSEIAGAELAEQVAAMAGRFGLPLGAPAGVGPLEDFLQAFRPVQAFEAWALYGAWIRQHRPRFGPGVRERFEAAAKASCDERSLAQTRCEALRERVRALVGRDTVLCLPTTPTSAPPLDASSDQVEAVRFKTLCLTAVAGVAGLPQLSLPWLSDPRGPIGLSLIGPPGSDLQLLELAAKAAAAA